jgi:hypothetical protein
LLKRCETAIPTARTAFAVLRAPRIVLGLGGFFNPDDTDTNSQREQQRPHGTPPGVLAINAHVTLSLRVCAEQTSRPNPQTDVRRRRKTTRSEHSDPTGAQPVPVRLNWHHTAHILSRNASFFILVQIGVVDLIVKIKNFAICLDLKFVTSDDIDQVLCVRFQLRSVRLILGIH